jgi:hypothetical protein
LRCNSCSAMFDALERISETEEINHSENLPAKSLPWDKERSSGNIYWRAGLVISLLLLIGQIVYFEGYAFSQNPSLRPGLEKLCQQLNCHIPVYKNLDEFTLLHGFFNPLPDQNYLFQAVINNQAEFSQPYPNIKLTLLDYNGNAFAHRIFRPRDYLPEASSTDMAADAITEISLKIAAPKTKVGGSAYELIY